jgi:hypothetical protein
MGMYGTRSPFFTPGSAGVALRHAAGGAVGDFWLVSVLTKISAFWSGRVAVAVHRVVAQVGGAPTNNARKADCCIADLGERRLPVVWRLFRPEGVAMVSERR